jgi:hypothetical protein
VTSEPEFAAERAAFLRALDRQRPGRAVVAALGFAAGLACYAFTATPEGEKSWFGPLADYAGDVALLLALALALTTPWTTRQREAMWRQRVYRLRRRGARGSNAPV